MSPSVSVGGAECRPFGFTKPAAPNPECDGDGRFPADAVCMLAPLSDATHEGEGGRRGRGRGCLSRRAAWTSPLVHKLVLVTVSRVCLPPRPAL